MFTEGMLASLNSLGSDTKAIEEKLQTHEMGILENVICWIVTKGLLNYHETYKSKCVKIDFIPHKHTDTETEDFSFHFERWSGEEDKERHEVDVLMEALMEDNPKVQDLFDQLALETMPVISQAQLFSNIRSVVLDGLQKTILLIKAKIDEHMMAAEDGTEDNVEIQLQAVRHILRDNLLAMAALCESIILQLPPTVMEKQLNMQTLLLGIATVLGPIVDAIKKTLEKVLSTFEALGGMREPMELEEELGDSVWLALLQNQLSCWAAVAQIKDMASTNAETEELATRLEKEFEAACKSDDVQQLWITMKMDLLLKVMVSIVNGQPSLPEPSSADQEQVTMSHSV